MAKKKMSVLQLSHTGGKMKYLPAELVRLKSGIWEIKWWQTDPVDEVRKRQRKTFDLNRISDKNLRLKEAKRIINDINAKLPYGWPYNEVVEVFVEEVEEETEVPEQTVSEALQSGWKYKQKVIRDSSYNAYNSRVRHMQNYLERNLISDLPVSEFTKGKAFIYMDSIKGIGNCAYNNYLLYLHGIFNELKNREEIERNPFTGIPKKKASEKKRVTISDQKAQIIMARIKLVNPELYLAVLLLQYCFLRPAEMRKLRYGDIDLKRGSINIEGAQAKNDRSAVITIPDELIPILMDYSAEATPDQLLFPSKRKPGEAIGKNQFNLWHRVILNQLEEDGLIKNTSSITFYSWKDTGGMAMVDNNIDIVSVKDQMRHRSIETTQRYLTKLAKVNPAIKNMKINL